MTNQKPPTKAQMLSEIESAIAKMEKPWVVNLTAQARKMLMKPYNRPYLERAHVWAQYIITWEYGRMYSDDINADYRELQQALMLAQFNEDMRNSRPVIKESKNG